MLSQILAKSKKSHVCKNKRFGIFGVKQPLGIVVLKIKQIKKMYFQTHMTITYSESHIDSKLIPKELSHVFASWKCIEEILQNFYHRTYLQVDSY